MVVVTSMTGKLLDGVDVVAALQKLSGEGVAEDVADDAFAERDAIQHDQREMRVGNYGSMDMIVLGYRSDGGFRLVCHSSRISTASSSSAMV